MKLSNKFAIIIFLVVFSAVILSNFLVIPTIDLALKSASSNNLLVNFLIHFLALFFIIVVPATVIILLALKRSVIKPLASFNQIAKIIASGNLGQRVKIYTNDEIGELGKSINTIVEHLVGAFQNMAFSLRSEKNKEIELASSLNQLIKEKSKDEALLTSIGDAVIAVERSGKIILFNKAAERLTGFKINEALNVSYKEILKIVNEKDETLSEDIIKYAFLGILEHKVTHLAIVSKSESKIPISYSIGPIYDQSKTIFGVIVVLRDITYERDLDRMKDEFLSIASHELRTPMSAIKNLISMIFEGDYGQVNEELKDPLNDIGISTERLIQLVNDMLDVSRIESGRLKIELTNIHIKDIVEEVVKLMQPLVLQKQIKLIIENIGPEMIRTDQNKIKEVLNNLIGNSIKFTDLGQVAVSSKRVGSLVCVSVTDTGVGITKEDQTKLFSKFSQINTNQFVRPPGTGLGLYISREFIRKLGGDLWIEHSEVGKGSTFTFSLPVLQTTSLPISQLANFVQS